MNKDLSEYEKDLNEMKEQILKEGNTLLAKRDLLERFCEIDKEYNGRPWNLLQILANINILIGEKPCEDATDTNVGNKIQEEPCKEVIYKQDAIDALGEKPLGWNEDEYELGLQNQWEHDVDAIKALSPVTPKPKVGYWIVEKCGNIGHCSNCENFYTNNWHVMNYCPNCSARMIGSKKSEETK